ncbi:hypothetical protein GLAREA_03428 [Glarea lozoyensis ATCC 20868]|uniref:Uncharacterized protein n=1 Tax=Glarea lozoyensis (strain ATCC 20868 / MF5171) TaxID=1116229 RepID=S3DEQ9_GLAL2|nr:uncharacterized protein GLAREA_03428 [Glarea lozoyensis ATCC 20868]EPE30461.1 hypothetical protein GLAREA_03428 [Glarea lozoyensis ATCC 20868]
MQRKASHRHLTLVQSKVGLSQKPHPNIQDQLDLIRKQQQEAALPTPEAPQTVGEDFTNPELFSIEPNLD